MARLALMEDHELMQAADGEYCLAVITCCDYRGFEAEIEEVEEWRMM